jgi:hypothetical protein
MSQYRLPPKEKPPEHSFTASGVYLNYGNVKTYTNKTQCLVRVALLRTLGFDCAMSAKWPFTIRLVRGELNAKT